MKEIKLTRGKVTQVDDADFEWLNSFKWCARFDGYNWYAIRQRHASEGKRGTVSMHRFILDITDPKIKGEHKDHDGLNNQRYNLWTATHQQNMRNRKPDKNSSSQYIGVSFDKESRKWAAYVQVNGKLKRVGRFLLEKDAAKARDAAALKHYGETIYLNFPITEAA